MVQKRPRGFLSFQSSRIYSDRVGVIGQVLVPVLELRPRRHSTTCTQFPGRRPTRCPAPSLSVVSPVGSGHRGQSGQGSARSTQPRLPSPRILLCTPSRDPPNSVPVGARNSVLTATALRSRRHSRRITGRSRGPGRRVPVTVWPVRRRRRQGGLPGVRSGSASQLVQAPPRDVSSATSGGATIESDSAILTRNELVPAPYI